MSETAKHGEAYLRDVLSNLLDDSADFDKLKQLATVAVVGYFKLESNLGHHMGCECSGVAYADAIRAENEGDYTNLTTCNSFKQSMATLRKFLGVDDES